MQGFQAALAGVELKMPSAEEKVEHLAPLTPEQQAAADRAIEEALARKRAEMERKKRV